MPWTYGTMECLEVEVEEILISRSSSAKDIFTKNSIHRRQLRWSKVTVESLVSVLVLFVVLTQRTVTAVSTTTTTCINGKYETDDVTSVTCSSVNDGNNINERIIDVVNNNNSNDADDSDTNYGSHVPRVQHHRLLHVTSLPLSSDDDCGLYIAKSSLPNAGLGIFNGNRPKTMGDTIQQQQQSSSNLIATGSGDICIPIIDMIWHNDNLDVYSSRRRRRNNGGSSDDGDYGQSPLLNYYMTGNAMGMQEESIFHSGSGTGTDSEVEAYCPGVHTIMNGHVGLRHVLAMGVSKYDDLSIPSASSSSTTSSSPSSSAKNNHYNKNKERYHRSTHPGVGAFTPYFSGTTIVNTGTIPPYTELFQDYGDAWFVEGTHELGNVPLLSDYDNLRVLLQRFTSLNITKKVLPYYLQSNQSQQLSQHEDESRVQAQLEGIVELYEMILQKIQTIYGSRTLNALPSKFNDAIFIGTGSDGVNDDSDGDPMTTYLLNEHTTNISYVQEYGTCIDQIRSGRSTLSNAGHGGFATRYFPMGTVLTAAPLLIIPDERVLFMYNFTKYDPTTTRFRNYKQRNHYQLLYNYCYGHPFSTLLLCPYGSGINLINHNRSLVNVKIEWTTQQLAFIHNTSLVRNGTIRDLISTTGGIHQQSSQLVFQYVATRDIEPNEELFLDYGDEWEHAWQYHVKHYPYSTTGNNDDATPKYISAHEFNYFFHDTVVRTMDEQSVDPYPNNLQIRCHRSLFVSNSIAHGIYEWKEKDYGLSCRIVDRWVEHAIITSSSNMELYTVQIQYVPTEYVTEKQYDRQQHDVVVDDDAETTRSTTYDPKKATWVTRTDVPRSAIRFYDVPYTTDLHQTSAFRHNIQIPDDIFPHQWKNYQF